MPDRTRLDHLSDATPQELLEELVRRRQAGLRDCSDQELEAELSRRGVERDSLPKYVEK